MERKRKKKPYSTTVPAKQYQLHHKQNTFIEHHTTHYSRNCEYW